jgi:threonine dehydratase
VIELDDVRRAAARLDGVAHRTPAISSRTLDDRAGARVYLKAENLQRVGAFKFRGAYNAIASLSDAERDRGVAAVSSGNHAQAVALAARLLGTHATILMPEDAPPNKRAATHGYGAEVIGFDRYAVQRDELLDELVASRGLVAVHPYENPSVQAGQGTLALELLEQAAPLDAVLVPIGGGGLISGVATAIKAVSPDTRVIGVQPEAGDDARRSLAAGRRVELPVPRTICDGQQAPIGDNTWAVIRERVNEVVVASDAEIVAAMVFAFERLKLVIEPSGASALAALLAGRVETGPDMRIGVVLTGGNVSAERFRELTDESRRSAGSNP